MTYFVIKRKFGQPQMIQIPYPIYIYFYRYANDHISLIYDKSYVYWETQLKSYLSADMEAIYKHGALGGVGVVTVSNTHEVPQFPKGISKTWYMNREMRKITDK